MFRLFRFSLRFPQIKGALLIINDCYCTKSKILTFASKFLNMEHPSAKMSQRDLKFRNNSPNFVGIIRLKEIQREQVGKFELWTQDQDWISFHRSHYDWWTFPINEISVNQVI